MERKVISTKNAPEAIGPYNQAIKASGNFIYTAGQIALNPETGEMVGETIQEQTHQAIKNIQAVLQAAGADLKNIIKTTVILNDMNDFVAMNEIYASYFSEEPPARATFGGCKLPKAALVEMECVAVI
jgi:2-iminobutanoate/2-iminopropanoate deaminase